MPSNSNPAAAVLHPDLALDTSIKILGLGGIGSIVARYGAVFLASLEQDLRLVMVDGDSFESSNASRMLFGSCGNKAAVTREELLPHFRDSRLAVVAVEEFIDQENVGRLVRDGDIVILCVDNHATRKLVNDHCAGLRDVCLISGGNDGVEQAKDGPARRGTFGNVQVYRRRGGKDLDPALTRYHPEIARPADKLPTDLSCTELITSVPQVLFANLTVAAAILNTLLLHCCDQLAYPELVLDIAEGLMRPVMLPGGEAVGKAGEAARGSAGSRPTR